MSLPTARVRAITFPPPPITAEPDSPEGAGLARLHLNEAPMGPSPKALAAAVAALAHAHRYPDHAASELIGQIAKATGIAADCISVGNGSGEILVALAQMAIDPGDEAVFPAPTFPTCGKGVQIAGGRLINVPLRADGVNDVPAMLDAITDRTRLFYLCTPNNPTGGILPAEDLALAAQKVPDDCLLVVDEAYFEFTTAQDGADALSILRNRTAPWVVTRSFSKAYCLAGLRAGYALCSSREICDALWTLRPNFNINRPALAAASAALADTEHLAAVLDHANTERARLSGSLRAQGCKLFPGATNFLTFQPAGNANAIAASLKEQGVLVQALPWPDADGSLRVTLGSTEENDRFLALYASAVQDPA